MIDLSHLTAQQVFDRAVAGLAEQGFQQSMGGAGRRCQYRGDEGRKCAAGHLIPDAQYDPFFEGSTWDSIVEMDEATDDHANLVIDLQNAHDDATDPESMQDELRRVAGKYGLALPAVLTLDGEDSAR